MTAKINLNDLKALQIQGNLLYTNATETGVAKNGVIRLEGPAGIDQVLMDIGFEFLPDMAKPKEGLFWMKRGDKKEFLRYHPLAPADPPVVSDLGMKTRVDYFGKDKNPSDAVYDTAKVLLDKGYQVLVPQPRTQYMDRLYHFKPQEDKPQEEVSKPQEKGGYEASLVMLT